MSGLQQQHTYVDGNILPGQWLDDEFSNIYGRLTGTLISVKDYGAKGDGVTDDASAINAAIAAAPATGGVVWFPVGVYAVGSTITIGNGSASASATTGHNVRLWGPGAGGQSAGTYATGLKWIGASGGTMVKFLGEMFGAGFGGIALDGNSLAATALLINHVVDGVWGDITVKGCTGDSMKLTTQTSAAAYGCGGNVFPRIRIALLSGANGLVLDGDTTTANHLDVAQCQFGVVEIDMNGTNNLGLVLGFCDFNEFGIVSVTSGTVSGTTYGVYYKGNGPSGSGNFPGANAIHKLFASSAGVGASTASGTPFLNRVGYYDTESSAPVPTVAGVSGLAMNPGGDNHLDPFGIGSPMTLVASTDRKLLSTTAATNVAQVNSPRPGLYLALVYVQVVTATTTVSVVGFGSEEVGDEFYYAQAIKSGATGLTALQGASLTTGSYQCLPMILRWSTGGANTPLVQVTAGTANQVYASVRIYALT